MSCRPRCPSSIFTFSIRQRANARFERRADARGHCPSDGRIGAAMTTHTTTPDWRYPRIVAHRGGGSLAPENTLAAIDTGARMGLTMIEFDAKLSADDVVFL